VLDVTGVATGRLEVGQVLRDDGGLLLPGTRIEAQQTGTGGLGTYIISPGQTRASMAMHVLRMTDRLTVRIDQIPVVEDADVDVRFE